MCGLRTFDTARGLIHSPLCVFTYLWSSDCVLQCLIMHMCRQNKQTRTATKTQNTSLSWKMYMIIQDVEMVSKGIFSSVVFDLISNVKKSGIRGRIPPWIHLYLYTIRAMSCSAYCDLTAPVRPSQTCLWSFSAVLLWWSGLGLLREMSNRMKCEPGSISIHRRVSQLAVVSATELTC